MTEPGFRVNDRRQRSRNSGLIVGQSVDQAKEFLREAGRLPRDGVTFQGVGDTNPYSRARGEDDVVTEMRRNRRLSSMQHTANSGAIPGFGPAGANVSFATGRPRDPMFYWRQNNIPYDVTKDDELKKIREFCNTPEAPIWMGDYSFKPIGEVQVGDEVIGWEYHTGPKGSQRKKLVRTVVRAVNRRIAPEVVRVTMESGKVIRCTPDHQWANYYHSPTQKEVLDRRVNKTTGRPRNKPIAWKQPEYKPAQVGGYLTSFIDPTPELVDDKQRMAAMWLAGLYDGEGCGNELGQSATHNPAVCQRIKDSLDVLGLPWNQRPNAIYIRQSGQGYRWGAQQDLVNFLNWTEPTRKVTKQNDAALLVRPSGGKDRVVAVDSEGPGEVVSMQTETGNYVAWGFASKNCRLLYLTHPVVAAATDIFTKFPLQGMDLECLAGETEVITDRGLRPIAELSGEVHTLLTTGGNWTSAKVEEFGQRTLQRITLKRNRRTKTLYATENHRWFVWREEGAARSRSGASNPSARLSWDQVCEIRDIAAQKDRTQTQIGDAFGITQSAVSAIVGWRTWKTPGEKIDSVPLRQKTKREVVTRELQFGDKLVSIYPTNRCHSINPSPFGIAHGMTFGDGTLTSSGGGACVDLHGHKDHQMIQYFQGCTQTDVTRAWANVQATRVSDLPAFFKKAPSITEGASYLYGWLAGYFAADGTVSQEGECYLDSVKRENVEFARDVCARLGIKTYEPYVVRTAEQRLPQGTVIEDWVGYRLPIDPASLTEAFFCIAEHGKRWIARGERERHEDWVVEEVVMTSRHETVYCAKVPGTEAFGIEGNILTGNCKDDQLTDFYGTLFFDQLDYPNYLLDIGREYWLVGEAWPLGSFNEILGVWDDDELLNPDDVQVERSPFLKDPRFLIRLPETLRRVLQERSPAWEYDKLMQSYPELAAYAGRDSLMPVSNVLLKQLRFKGDTFHKRGIPILMRGFRAIVQEEMLNAALDAIADRLYTPLVLAKLGASAQDLGTNVPWIPTQNDLQNFEEAVDAALAGDFRIITHHFATSMEPVFGRENMPDLSADFDRVLDRILMVYGLSRTMLNGAEQGETYAADALNRDIVSQLLTHYQDIIKAFYKDRALVVAEAQEHFDYDVRGGRRYVKMEEVLEIDEESGEQRIVEQPALLVPDMVFKTMTLANEQDERQFREALNQAGVPIPYQRRLQGTGMDFDDIIEKRKSENVALAIAEQETRKEIFKALRAAGLPLPDDLIEDFQPKPITPGTSPMAPGQDEAIPMLGQQPDDFPALAPSLDDLQNDEDDQDQGEGSPIQAGPGGGQVIMMPQPDVDQEGDRRPAESDEQRKNMPKPAALKPQPYRYERGQVRQAALDYYQAPDNEREIKPEHYQPTGKFGDPKHLGMRRHVLVPDESQWNSTWSEETG